MVNLLLESNVTSHGSIKIPRAAKGKTGTYRSCHHPWILTEQIVGQMRCLSDGRVETGARQKCRRQGGRYGDGGLHSCFQVGKECIFRRLRNCDYLLVDVGIVVRLRSGRPCDAC
jgi:hypothetical protein